MTIQKIPRKKRQFWKPISECPRKREHYYLIRTIFGIIAAKWWEDEQIWRSQYGKEEDRHVTHFAEIPPLTEREVKP